MLRKGLIALAMLVFCAGGRILAADSAVGAAPASGDRAGATEVDPLGKLPVTRVELAVAVARALAGGDAEVPAAVAWPSYRDVPETHWAFRYIEYASSMGVVSGYADGTYRPEGLVDRGQMAVFLARALVAPLGDSGLIGYLPPLTPAFSDVGPGHWAYAHIQYLVDPDRKITQGYPDGSYRPRQVCTRDEMAALLARAFPTPKPAVEDQVDKQQPGDTPTGTDEAEPKRD